MDELGIEFMRAACRDVTERPALANDLSTWAAVGFKSKEEEDEDEDEDDEDEDDEDDGKEVRDVCKEEG